MPLVAIGVDICGGQVGDVGVAEGEGIAVVIVVRLVLRVGVVDFELQVVRRPLVDAKGNAVVLALGGRLDDRQRADAVSSAGAEARGPRRAAKGTAPGSRT